ncbi:hypothetical protein TNCV_2131661 [Trichonephila clavipes]|nr:hypothetical protein TNCV_2131661 [Trichonephila clavipes]
MVSRTRGESVAGSSPSATEDLPCRGYLCTLNLSKFKHPPVGAEVRTGVGQLRSRPRHLTEVQNYEVRLQQPSCCFRVRCLYKHDLFSKKDP